MATRSDMDESVEEREVKRYTTFKKFSWTVDTDDLPIELRDYMKNVMLQNGIDLKAGVIYEVEPNTYGSDLLDLMFIVLVPPKEE